MTRPLLAPDDYWLAEFEPDVDGREIVHAAVIRHMRQQQQRQRWRQVWRVVYEVGAGTLGAVMIFGSIWLAIWMNRT